MAACNVQDLVSEAACYTCISPGMQELVNTALLCRIARALDPTMTCDVQALIRDAACYTCIPPGMQALVNTALLCAISQAIGGGMPSSDQVACGHGAPVAAPSGTCSIYYDLDSTAFYF